MKRHCLIALILFGSLVAFAQTASPSGLHDLSSVPASGNDFLRVCGGESISNGVQGFCDGYLFGSVEMLKLDQADKHLICIPDGVTYGQEHNIVLKWIRDNPKVTHERTTVLIRWAIVDAFLCPKK